VEILCIYRTESDSQKPFPTLEIAEAVRKVFGVEPNVDNPFEMGSNPDYVAFPGVTVSGDQLHYCSTGSDSNQEAHADMDELESALSGFQVEIITGLAVGQGT